MVLSSDAAVMKYQFWFYEALDRGFVSIFLKNQENILFNPFGTIIKELVRYVPGVMYLPQK